MTDIAILCQFYVYKDEVVKAPEVKAAKKVDSQPVHSDESTVVSEYQPVSTRSGTVSPNMDSMLDEHV